MMKSFEYIARRLGCDPDTPENWPMHTIEYLQFILEEYGEASFIQKVIQLTTPPKETKCHKNANQIMSTSYIPQKVGGV